MSHQPPSVSVNVWVLFWPVVRQNLLFNSHISSGISGGSSCRRCPFQYLTTIFTLRMWMCAPSFTCTDTWSWQSAHHYWSAVRGGHGRMTAVTESPLPQHSGELKTNKPADIGREGEMMFVLLRELPGVLILRLQWRWGFFVISCHTLLVHRCCTGKLPQWF